MANPAQFPTGDHGSYAVTKLDSPGVEGFHLAPKDPQFAGAVVTFGGSEGSPDFSRAENPVGPITVLGTSKGAKLVFELARLYPEITNVIAIAPTEFRWRGIGFSMGEICSRYLMK